MDCTVIIAFALFACYVNIVTWVWGEILFSFFDSSLWPLDSRPRRHLPRPRLRQRPETFGLDTEAGFETSILLWNFILKNCKTCFVQIWGFLSFVQRLLICLLCAKLFATICSNSKEKRMPYSCKQNSLTTDFLNLEFYYLTEVESRTQGSRPRPRTPKKSEAKAKNSLSEDRTSRGQGQKCLRPRPRTKDTGASVLQKRKKKGPQNFFSGDLEFIGVPRIFDWGRPKPQITWNDVIKNFSKRKFLWDKDIVGWKIWNRYCLFAHNQDFAKEEGLY